MDHNHLLTIKYKKKIYEPLNYQFFLASSTVCILMHIAHQPSAGFVTATLILIISLA